MPGAKVVWSFLTYAPNFDMPNDGGIGQISVGALVVMVKANRKLFTLRKIRPYITQKIAALLYKQFILCIE